jgi:hypothetical protein
MRLVLDAMLGDPQGLVRQAAVFGLGELGGEAVVRRLKQQLAVEEARGDLDGQAVAEEITRALGRIQGAGARATLVKRLEQRVAGKLERSELTLLARALWKIRHPDLIPAVQRSLKRVTLPVPHALHGLLVLLERTPEELATWVLDPSVSVQLKTRLLTVLEEDVPDAMAFTLSAFVSAASSLAVTASSQAGDAADYCERLFRLLVLHRERLIDALPDAAHSELRTLARALVGSPSINCAFQAATLLKFVGKPEDAALIEAHCPAHPELAEDFARIARAVRSGR